MNMSTPPSYKKRKKLRDEVIKQESVKEKNNKINHNNKSNQIFLVRNKFEKDAKVSSISTQLFTGLSQEKSVLSQHFTLEKKDEKISYQREDI